MDFVRLPVWFILAVLCALCMWNRPGSAQTGAARIAQHHAPQITANQAGELDTSFGNGGVVNTDMLGSVDEAMAVVIQPDGKIIAAGGAYNGSSSDFALARYNVNGSLDTDFGTNGKVTTHVAGGTSFINCMALQTNGRILVAGNVKTGDATKFDFALARYRASGGLDTSFGTNGLVITDFFNGDDNVWAIAIQPDGKIIAAGRANNAAQGADFGLARYNTDGTLDTTFGPDHTGKVLTDLGRSNYIHAVALLANGKIVVAGQTYTSSSNADFVLARYTAEGTLDSSFGDSGVVISDFFGLIDNGWYLAIQPDNKIIVTGCVTRSQEGTTVLKPMVGLARYHSDGSLDPSFGGAGGQVALEFIGMDIWAYTGALLADGRIMLGGAVALEGSPSSFGLACFTSDGMLDSAFGGIGGVETDFFGDTDFVNGMAVQSDGKLVAVGGTMHPLTEGDFALARYLMSSGNLSIGFDSELITGSRGTTVRVWVNINRGGSPSVVTVTPPDTSAIGVKMKPPLPLVTTDDRVGFKLKIKGGAAVGPHLLTFNATDNQGRSHTASVTLIIE